MPTTGRYTTFHADPVQLMPWCSQISTVPEQFTRFTNTREAFLYFPYRIILDYGREKLSAVAEPISTGSDGTADPTTAT
jgi:hypothetical protein